MAQVMVAVAAKLESDPRIRIGPCVVEGTVGHGIVQLDARGSGLCGLADRGSREERGDGQSSNQSPHDNLPSSLFYGTLRFPTSPQHVEPTLSGQ
jgi:hypothetical protein